MIGNSSLLGDIALVTGASSGIGRAAALALAREGARLALAARSKSDLRGVASEIRQIGSDALVVPADVTRRSEVESAVSETRGHWGQIDILVANAGSYVRSPTVELTIADLEESMAVNFYGAAYAVLAVQPSMVNQGSGHIVFVSSMDAKKGLPNDAPYVAAKCALSGYAGVLRQELQEFGIDVTTVFPGRVDTPLIRNLEVPRVSAKIPPEAVAQAIVDGIRRNKAEIIIPRHARLLYWLDTASPRLGDWIVRLFGLEGRETAETVFDPRGAEAREDTG